MKVLSLLLRNRDGGEIGYAGKRASMKVLSLLLRNVDAVATAKAIALPQ